MYNGIKGISKAASVTLGPGGRTVALEYENGDPKITKDGVTVVKSVFEEQRAHQIGQKLIKQVAG
jgi:chaperonin GroEL